MGGEASSRVECALKILHHLRRCLEAFVNGEVRAGRRDPAYWLSLIHASPQHWRYPLVPAWLPEACMALGIRLPANLPPRGGIKELYQLLIFLDAPLRQAISHIPAEPGETRLSKRFDPAAYAGSLFAKLSTAFQPLNDPSMEGVNLYLHGSLADLTFTDFSDVDDLVLLSGKAWQSADQLERIGAVLGRISRAYQDIDPYQHHGHLLLTEFDLLLFAHQPIPVVVFEDMCLVRGLEEFTYRVTTIDHASLIALENTLRAMRSRLARLDQFGGLRAFELKELAGEIALLPAYLFQAQGEMLSKPQAIGRADDLFSPGALKALEWATFLRGNFTPLIKHPRVQSLKRLARKTCPRRHQAETLLRRWSPWVVKNHPLGVNSEVHAAIQEMIKESQATFEIISG